MADKETTVIDLEAARVARLPENRFAELGIDGDRIRVLADCRLTVDAAEAFARELYILAGKVRARHG